MKVLYDSLIFGLQDYGGISRLFSQLISRLKKNKIEHDLPYFVHNNDYMGNNYGEKKDLLLSKNKFKNYFYTFLNMIFSLPKIIYGDYDLFHPTYYETYFLPFIGKKKYIVTVFDFVHEKYSTKYNKLSKRLQKNKKKLLEKATHIIAISENTKKDAINFYNIDPKKISVVYLGSSLLLWDKNKKLNLPEKYILFVGKREFYKNFKTFIQAMKSLAKKYPDLHVICAGGGDFTREEVDLLKKSQLEKIIHHHPFSNDRDLSEIYARSTLFAYPSLYEGFGIPILEAFLAGTPIAVSKSSCFPEVAGQAAVYFNPKSGNSIALAIKKLLDDEKLRKDLVKKGRDRLRSFSWEKTAKETAQVYKKILKQQ